VAGATDRSVFTKSDGDLRRDSGLPIPYEAWKRRLTKITQSLRIPDRVPGRRSDAFRRSRPLISRANVLGQPIVGAGRAERFFPDTNAAWAAPEGMKLRRVSRAGGLAPADHIDPRDLLELAAADAGVAGGAAHRRARGDAGSRRWRCS